MTLQELWDKCIAEGANPNTQVYVEYCDVESVRVVSCEGGEEVIIIN